MSDWRDALQQDKHGREVPLRYQLAEWLDPGAFRNRCWPENWDIEQAFYTCDESWANFCEELRRAGKRDSADGFMAQDQSLRKGKRVEALQLADALLAGPMASLAAQEATP